MRIFYIYNINDTFSNTYQNYPFKLYKMLEETYFINKSNKTKAINYYSQITNKFNKLFINDYLSINNKPDIYYYTKDNVHIISSQEEYSKLLINSYYLKLKTTINYPKFFKYLNNYSSNIFICDFANQDYFWLNKVIKEDRLIHT